jgi:sigma-E factor negative regulatory protein RseA
MKQRISDLMDGELDADQCDAALRSLAKDDELRDCWHTYHLIGDCLRGEALAGGAPRPVVTEKILARLAEEPTVLAPRHKSGVGRVGGRTRVALALAASVATLSVIGVIASRQAQLVEPQIQVAQQQAAQGSVSAAQRLTAPPATSNGAPNVNDYLVLHRQFSNPEAFQPASMVSEGNALRQGAGR